MAQANLSVRQKQSQRHREQICCCQGGGEWGRDERGVWNQQIQTIIYRMNKQEGPTSSSKPNYLSDTPLPKTKVLPYSTGNQIQYHVINYNGKEYIYIVCVYVYVYIYTTELLCYIAEINTTL